MSKPRRELGFARCLLSLQRILKNKGVTGLKNPCSQYFSNNRRHLRGGSAVMLIIFLLSYSSLISTVKQTKELTMNGGETAEYQKWHEVIDAGNGSVLISNHFGTCSIEPPVHPPSDVKLTPILAASFPGSSSEVIRFLLEAMTGFWTSARTFRDDVVAIKTHYPYYDKHINIKSIKNGDPKAIFVLHHPLGTIEAWQGWYYRTVRKIKGNIQPPLKDWIEWRDKYFEFEIKQWKKHLEYWLDNLPEYSRMVLVYENLMDDVKGPTEAQKLAKFISQSKDIKLTGNDLIPCIWYQIVKFQHLDRRRLLENNHYEPPYTFEQLDFVAGVLTEIIDKYEAEITARPILLRYRNSVLEKMENLHLERPIMVKNPRGRCIVTTPLSKDGLTPIYQASYPGSGSEMTEHLIEALTGVKTSEFKREENVIAVKTYFPLESYHVGKRGRYNRDMNRAILLLRNPVHTISSHFNHLFEQSNNLEQHSVSAPLDVWVEWRDANFGKELDAWKEHTEYWMDNFQYPDKLIISYEALIDNKMGPKESQRIVQFLNNNGNMEDIPTAPLATVPCLWYRVFNYYKSTRHDSSTEFYHTKFSAFQLESIATVLNNLKLKYQQDSVLSNTLNFYWKDVISRMN